MSEQQIAKHAHRHREVGELFEDAVKSIYQLRDIPEHEEFVLPNGEHLKSLVDLQAALAQMDDDVFNCHVNEWKNDFAAWVYNTIGDHELAEKLGPLKTKAQNLRAVRERVRHLVTEKIKHH